MTFEEWALNVLKREGLGDWKVVPGEAYCWIDQKTIHFRFDEYGGDFQLFLHEVAHALHPDVETEIPGARPNHYHGSGFVSTFGKLVTKYMQPRVEGLEDVAIDVVTLAEHGMWSGRRSTVDKAKAALKALIS